VEVTSLVSGDRVLTAVLTGVGGEIEKDTYTGAASGNGSGDPDFVVQESIAGDTPSAGWFRVDNGDGTEDRYAYSSWTGSTFTLDAIEHPGGLGRTYNSVEDVWVPLLDLEADSTSENNSLIYSADIPVRIRVRKKGIIPFEIDGTVSSTGLSQAAIRTTDTIVS
jgi:hypothetical protein